MDVVDLGIATEMIKVLRYKLSGFVVTLEGPAEVFCDKKSVVKKSIIPTSVLNNRHNAIC